MRDARRTTTVALGLAAAAAVLLGSAAGASADDGVVSVAIVDERGAPVFCTTDATAGHARPDADGGYHLVALRPGRWIVSLDLPYERVDVLVTATAGDTVVVPPVVARGRCRAIALTRRLDLRQLVWDQPANWSVSFDRTYAARAVAPPPWRRRLAPPLAPPTSAVTRALAQR